MTDGITKVEGHDLLDAHRWCVASKLDKLVILSAAMAGDAAFARQARRKFV